MKPATSAPVVSVRYLPTVPLELASPCGKRVLLLLRRMRALSQALALPGRYPNGREGLRDVLEKRLLELGAGADDADQLEALVDRRTHVDRRRIDAVHQHGLHLRLQVGDLEMDLLARTVKRGGKKLEYVLVRIRRRAHLHHLPVHPDVHRAGRGNVRHRLRGLAVLC